MNPEVKKLPYTIDAVKYPYDITRAQPQLFVTPTFQNLVDVLETFANTMSFRVGGAGGLQKAMDCKMFARPFTVLVSVSNRRIYRIHQISIKNNQSIYIRHFRLVCIIGK